MQDCKQYTRNEALIGLLFIVFCILLTVALFVFDIVSFNKQHKIVHIEYMHIGTLKIGAPLLLGGVQQIGKVIDIQTMTDRVVVTVMLFDEYNLYANQSPRPVTMGFIGDYYLFVDIPNENDTLHHIVRSGDTIRGADPINLLVIHRKMNPQEMFSLLKGLGEQLQRIAFELDEIKGQAAPYLEKLSYNTKRLQKLYKNAVDREMLERIHNNISAMNSNIEEIVSAIKTQQGSLGKMLYKKTFKNNLNNCITELKKIQED